VDEATRTLAINGYRGDTDEAEVIPFRYGDGVDSPDS